jgi:ribosomal protein L7/L12
MERESLISLLKIIKGSDPDYHHNQGWNNAIISILKGVTEETSQQVLEKKISTVVTYSSADSIAKIVKELSSYKRTESKLGAVKYVKDLTGMMLKESKEFIDDVWELLP